MSFILLNIFNRRMKSFRLSCGLRQWKRSRKCLVGVMQLQWTMFSTVSANFRSLGQVKKVTERQKDRGEEILNIGWLAKQNVLAFFSFTFVLCLTYFLLSLPKSQNLNIRMSFN
jgi:hypothetical protein